MKQFGKMIIKTRECRQVPSDVYIAITSIAEFVKRLFQTFNFHVIPKIMFGANIYSIMEFSFVSLLTLVLTVSAIAFSCGKFVVYVSCNCNIFLLRKIIAKGLFLGQIFSFSGFNCKKKVDEITNSDSTSLSSITAVKDKSVPSDTLRSKLEGQSSVVPLKLAMDDIISSESYQSNPYGPKNTTKQSAINNTSPSKHIKYDRNTSQEKDIYAASNRKFFNSSIVVNQVPLSPAREESDYIHTVDKAKEMMYAMSGLPPGFVISRTWKSVYVDQANNTNLWLEKSKKDGGNSILLRGICSVPIKSSACTVPEIVKWLIAEDLVTGIEGLSYRSEVVEKISNESEFIMVRRMFCKSGLISSKREFTLVTSITANVSDGSYIMATRSVANDFTIKPKGD